MPTVTVGTTTIECDHGAILRDVLQEYDLDIDPHNGTASLINCRGHGTCGTCAVEIQRKTHHRSDTQASDDNDVSTDTADITDTDMTTENNRRIDTDSPDTQGSDDTSVPVDSHTVIERIRLSVPPHTSNPELRLACQTRVRGDITVIKHDGLWGHHTDDDQDKQ